MSATITQQPTRWQSPYAVAMAAIRASLDRLEAVPPARPELGGADPRLQAPQAVRYAPCWSVDQRGVWRLFEIKIEGIRCSRYGGVWHLATMHWERRTAVDVLPTVEAADGGRPIGNWLRRRDELDLIRHLAAEVAALIRTSHGLTAEALEARQSRDEVTNA